MFNIIFLFSWSLLSWEKARKNIIRIQKRIYKSVWVGDLDMALRLQKLLLVSNSSRLVAIRLVTQTSLHKSISGVDGKVSLNFSERFELNKCLLNNVNNWYPQNLKEVFFTKKNGDSVKYRIPTIADRAWHCLVKLAIEPAHEAVFNPRSFGYRDKHLVFDLQKIVFLNLCKSSFGFQKRILIFSFSKDYPFFNQNLLLKKVIAPRFIKVGIFRFFKVGFFPSFLEGFENFNGLESLLANILIHGIENIHNMVRYGSNLLLFLNPIDNESLIVGELFRFLNILDIEVNLSRVNVKIVSSIVGFDFLGWHFKVYKNNYLFCSPSESSYASLLKRVKHIINNSNYGAL